MKRWIALLLAAMLALSFCACDSGKKGAATGSDLSWKQIEKLAEEELAREAAAAEN